MKKVNEQEINEEKLKIVKREELKEKLKKHTKNINLYEILIAITMGIYDVCDDMSYVTVENVFFVFIAYFFFAMVKLKIIEKLLGHIIRKYNIKNELDKEPEYFEWKYKTLKKN